MPAILDTFVTINGVKSGHHCYGLAQFPLIILRQVLQDYDGTRATSRSSAAYLTYKLQSSWLYFPPCLESCTVHCF